MFRCLRCGFQVFRWRCLMSSLAVFVVFVNIYSHFIEGRRTIDDSFIHSSLIVIHLQTASSTRNKNRMKTKIEKSSTPRNQIFSRAKKQNQNNKNGKRPTAQQQQSIDDGLEIKVK